MSPGPPPARGLMWWASRRFPVVVVRDRACSAGGRPAQVVARPHLVHELPLALVLDRDPRALTRRTGHVSAIRELVRPGAVLADEDDPGATLADVFDDRPGAAVSGGERPDPVHQ